MKKAGGMNGWHAVNDDVMGGVSRGGARITDQGSLLFLGEISFENNGGFASIRHDAAPFGITQGEGIRLRVMGDGKQYQLRIGTSIGGREINYKCTFTTMQGEWLDLEMRWDQFTATYRGRFIPDAPKLQGASIRRIGFLIADKQEGPFMLEIDAVDSLQPARPPQNQR